MENSQLILRECRIANWPDTWRPFSYAIFFPPSCYTQHIITQFFSQLPFTVQVLLF